MEQTRTRYMAKQLRCAAEGTTGMWMHVAFWQEPPAQAVSRGMEHVGAARMSGSVQNAHTHLRAVCGIRECDVLGEGMHRAILPRVGQVTIRVLHSSTTASSKPTRQCLRHALAACSMHEDAANARTFTRAVNLLRAIRERGDNPAEPRAQHAGIFEKSLLCPVRKRSASVPFQTHSHHPISHVNASCLQGEPGIASARGKRRFTGAACPRDSHSEHTRALSAPNTSNSS